MALAKQVQKIDATGPGGDILRGGTEQAIQPCGQHGGGAEVEGLHTVLDVPGQAGGCGFPGNGVLAALARRQGRRVVAITDAPDTGVFAWASAQLPVQGRVREEFSPLLYHVFAGYMAFYLALINGFLKALESVIRRA